MNAPAYTPAFSFSVDERTAQDARLDPIIADLWAARGEFTVTWWRDSEPFRSVIHPLWLNMFAAARTTGDTTVLGAYLNAVLALATTAAGPFVPVDLWPSMPPVYTLPRKGQFAFDVAANKMREGAHVFTPGKLRRNKHYFLLIAHLLLWPEEVHAGADLLPHCYPWPFIIKIDEEGTPRLERQEDIRGEGWDIAQRIEMTLFEDTRQVDRLPYGTSQTAKSRRDIKVERRLLAGEIANRLYDTMDPETIAKHPAFKVALTADDGSVVGRIDSGDGVLKLIRHYRGTHNLPPLPRGRPQKRLKS